MGYHDTERNHHRTMTYSKLNRAEGTLNQLPCTPNNQEKTRISPTEEDCHIDVPGWGQLV